MRLEEYDYTGAIALAVVLLVFSFVLLAVINLLEQWASRFPTLNMANNSQTNRQRPRKRSQRGTEESPFVKWTLIAIALAFCLRVPAAAAGQRLRAGAWPKAGRLLDSLARSRLPGGHPTHAASWPPSACR